MFEFYEKQIENLKKRLWSNIYMNNLLFEENKKQKALNSFVGICCHLFYSVTYAE